MAIVNFKTYEDFIIFFEKNRSNIKLGQGFEGVCYKSKNNNDLALKKLRYKLEDTYIINNIITEDDIKLDSFCFPKDLYVYKDKLVGYSSKLIKNDILLNEDILGYNRMKYLNEKRKPYIKEVEIDFSNIENAYYTMLDDVDELSNNNIKMFDLTYNLAFNKENLYAIDTCHYNKSNISNLKEFNRKSLLIAIDEEVCLIIENAPCRIYAKSIDKVVNHIKNKYGNDMKIKKKIIY